MPYIIRTPRLLSDSDSNGGTRTLLKWIISRELCLLTWCKFNNLRQIFFSLLLSWHKAIVIFTQYILWFLWAKYLVPMFQPWKWGKFLFGELLKVSSIGEKLYLLNDWIKHYISYRSRELITNDYVGSFLHGNKIYVSPAPGFEINFIIDMTDDYSVQKKICSHERWSEVERGNERSIVLSYLSVKCATHQILHLWELNAQVRK